MNIKNKKIILLVIHNCSFSGAPLLALNIVKDLKSNGYFVFVICMEKGILFEKFKKYSYIIYSNTLLKTDIIIKILKLFGLRSIICNSVVTGDITKIAKQNKLRTITLIHELPGAVKTLKAEGKALNIVKYSHKVIFPNHYVRDKFTTIFPLDKNKILVRSQGLYMKIKNYYDEETKTQKKKKEGYCLNDKIIIGVGSGGKVKGIDLFFRVASIVHKTNENIKFIWIGTIDSQCSWINRKAKDNGITIIKPTNHIEDYYRIADLYLLTSREDSFPSVALETIAYGMPVLGFKDAGGFIELDHKFISFVDYLDCEAMAKALIKILDDKDMIEYVQVNGRKYITENFDFSEYVKDISHLLGNN